jgi:ribose transport system permease protein
VLLRYLERGGLLLLLLALIVFFSVDPRSGSVFATTSNLTTILGGQAVLGIVAIAMVVPLVSGVFDLSVPANVGLCNVVVAAAMSRYGLSPILAILVGVVVGSLLGAVNAFLVARLRLSAFIVTLGMYILINGLVELYTKGNSITANIPPSVGNWSGGTWFGVTHPFYLMLAVALVAWYVLTQTPYGRRLEAIGSSEPSARLVGIIIARVQGTSFLIAGFLAGVAGAAQTSVSGGSVPGIGPDYLFPAIAAVFLGATVLKPGRYNVWGTLIGVYVVAVSVSGFTLLGAATWVQPVFEGAALIAAVAASTLIERSRLSSSDHRAAQASDRLTSTFDGSAKADGDPSAGRAADDPSATVQR